MAMGLLSGIRALAWAIVLLMESWTIIQLLGGGPEFIMANMGDFHKDH